MTEVWFIRHGESQYNVGELLPDVAQANLTQRGRAQADEVGTRITGVPDVIVVTPYPRTLQTAEPALRRFPAARREIWPLHEFSPLSHAHSANTNAEMRRPIQEAYWQRMDPDYVDGEGAESFNDVVRRLRGALKKLQESKDDFVVIFSHGHVIRLLKIMLADPQLDGVALMKAFHEGFEKGFIQNGEITRLEADATGVRLKAQKPLPVYRPSPRIEAWTQKR